MLSADAKRRRFRALHEGPALLLPNAWDAGSARTLTDMRFAALATTSAGAAWSFGLADGGMTREQAIGNARAIADATDLPVSADLENGYGASPKDVVRTLILAAEAGLAGASIEDSSGDPEQPIYEVGDAIARIVAAVEANRSLSEPLMLTARAENFLHGRPDLDDTILRLRAFERAGADVLYAPGLPSLAAVRSVCAAVHKPVNVLAGGGNPTWRTDEIIAAGARRISVGSGLARMSLRGLSQAALALRRDGLPPCAQDEPTYAALNATMAVPPQS